MAGTILPEEGEEEGEGPLSRLLSSTAGLAATLLTIGRTRAELLTVELQLEVRRAAILLVWGLVALVAALLGLVAAGFAVVIAFWDTYRLLAAVLVVVFYFIAALVAALVLRHRVRTKPRMFAGTLAQLAEDSERLRRNR